MLIQLPIRNLDPPHLDALVILLASSFVSSLDTPRSGAERKGVEWDLFACEKKWRMKQELEE